MRTSVVLDDELVERAKAVTGIGNTTDLIHEALRTIIRLRAGEQMRELRGKLHWEGDLKAMRANRFDYD